MMESLPLHLMKVKESDWRKKVWVLQQLKALKVCVVVLMI